MLSAVTDKGVIVGQTAKVAVAEETHRPCDPSVG